MLVVKKNNTIKTFADLRVGDVFRFSVPLSEVFVKTINVKDACGGEHYNALNLESGDFTKASETEKVVFFPKAELVLND